jgi:hypothetical protein
MAKSKPGGGINSRVNVQPRVRTGSGAKGVSPGWVGQQGQAQGDHITNRAASTNYRGEPRLSGQNFQPVKFGNEVALNVGRGGPGSGRKLYGQGGTQGQHGTTSPGNPPSKSTDILRQFGPDYKAPGR